MTRQPAGDGLLRPIFDVSEDIRYVALKRGAELIQQQRPGVADASASESDRYEELFVNPGLLSLARARGDLDCGGLHYLIIRYGNFFQIVCPLEAGHVSVCVGKDGDPERLVAPILAACATVCRKLG